VELETVEGVNYDLHEFEVDPSSPLVGMTLAEAKLPPGALVSMIRRGKGFVPACGSTVIEKGDDLVVMGAPEKLHELSEKYFPESGYAQKHEVPRFLKKNIFTRNS
jgi:cell volume regulation protein A